nr:hypothetical protein [Tanacetum cinerariifolium]
GRYSIIHDIQQHMRGFLLCDGELKSGKAKVAWDDICLPKNEGGLAPDLSIIPPPALNSRLDLVQWKDSNGLISSFSVRAAWEALRPRGVEVLWYRVVWFSQCIPRHAFHLWLVMRNSLKTQDKLRQWDVGVGTDLNLLHCALCMDHVSPSMNDILLVLQPLAYKRTAKSVFLILAATSYFLWLERNNRLFKKVKKSPEEIRDIIIITVRLKLLTFRFKNTAMVADLLSRWKMPRNFRLYG